MTTDTGPQPDDEYPPQGELADPYDSRDWDRARDGRMADFATDDEPITEPWQG